MQVTFILKDLPESMIAELSNMDAHAAYDRLSKWAYGDLKRNVSVKYGSGAFRDRVNWNSIIKAGKLLSFKIEPRRGYKLVTFEA